MNTKRKIYFLITFITTALLYDQWAGLNLLLIAIIAVIYMAKTAKEPLTSKWWFASALFIGSALAITLTNGYLSLTLYVISTLHFFNVSQNQSSVFPYTLLKSWLSMIIGLMKAIIPESLYKSSTEDIDNTPKTKSFLKKAVTYSIPLIIIIVFLKLYQSASPTFKSYTEFLNLDFINWSFISLYLGLYVVLNGLYFYYKVNDLDQLGNSKQPEISPTYSDMFEKKLGLDYELKMSKMIIYTLTFMLTAFLVIDALTIFNVIDNHLTHSDNIHQGIFVLITSVVFVILIVAFVYRGQLNFKQDKALKRMTVFWLILNIILTGFNAIKNFNYINEWGLTHKRIGVYIYLILCLIGLGFTIYKILNQKTFWYLLNRTVMTFIAILIIYSSVNWNGMIAKFNLAENRFDTDKIDLYYITDLGYETYPYLIDYYQRHPAPESTQFKKLDYYVSHFKPRVKTWKDFPSFKLSHYLVYQKIKDYQPLKDNDYSPNWNRSYDSF